MITTLDLKVASLAAKIRMEDRWSTLKNCLDRDGYLSVFSDYIDLADPATILALIERLQVAEDAAKRASMEGAEPVFVARMFVDQLTGVRSAVLNKDAQVLPDMTRLYTAPLSTDTKDARLKHLYDKQMAQLVKPCMSYTEWLNAIDVCISGDATIAAKEPTP